MVPRYYMKPFGHMESLASNKGEIKRSINDSLLDLLIDGPSSFASLYGGLIQHYAYSNELGIQPVMEALAALEQEGLIRNWQMSPDGSFHDPTNDDRRKSESAYSFWLPRARLEEFSVDEVGLWYELTPKGCDEWRHFADHEAESSRQWMLDDDGDTQTITIQSDTAERAETALRLWLSYNPRMNVILGSKVVEPISAFVLHNGTVINDGVKLVCRYRSEPEVSRP